MRKIYTSLMLLFIGINAAWAVHISGTVITSDDSEPAIGASVIILDESNNQLTGIATDTNGKFDLSIPDAAAAVKISYIGQYDQRFTPGELNNKTIILQPNSTLLDEVVILGTRPTHTTQTSRGGDGCDDEKNDRITPELALCSVHAYNIGVSSNPTGADRQLMKDVVALKTTVIAQQMNKQYEYMEAMIRRFKTQLEKAVLTTKLQAAGATSASSDADSGGGTYGTKSSDAGMNRGLANAEDCMNTYSKYPDVYQCLMRNIPKIQSAVTAGDLGTARRQLKTDLDTLSTYNLLPLACEGQPNCRESLPCKNALAEKDNAGKNTACTIAKNNGGRRDDITTCLGQMRACVVANNDDIQRKKNNQRS